MPWLAKPFHRLLRFRSTVKERATPIWEWTVLLPERGREWLLAPREPADWKAARTTLLSLRTNASRLLVGAAVIAGLAIFAAAWRWYSAEEIINGTLTYTHASFANPVFAGIGAALLIGAAIWQARTATQRHVAQTDADRQRRITESFSKAVEQLGSEKLEVRLGGIYSLERISKESHDDYWTVMENLAAFVRERSKRVWAEMSLQDAEENITKRAYRFWEEAGQPEGRGNEFWDKACEKEKARRPPEADIAAALMVIKRRSVKDQKREEANGWRFDLNGAILCCASLEGINLKNVFLYAAHLEGAVLANAHLQRAFLRAARLDGANLIRAHLDGANLIRAHLNDANLESAHLEEADLRHARLHNAILVLTNLTRTRIGGADFGTAKAVNQGQMHVALGNFETKRPRGIEFERHWQVRNPIRDRSLEPWDGEQ